MYVGNKKILLAVRLQNITLRIRILLFFTLWLNIFEVKKF